MKNTIIKAGRDVNVDIILVFVVGVCGFHVFGGVMTWVFIAEVIVSFVVGIVIYGRIIARVNGRSPGASATILKENWSNCLLVLMVLAIPTLIFGQISGLFASTPTSYVLTKKVLDASVRLLTIYVLPIVFLKKENMIAILTGIIYLFRSLRMSLPIVGIAALIELARTSVLLRVEEVLQKNEQIQFSHVTQIIVVNIICTYLAFVVFASAARVLTGQVCIHKNGA